jgi:hypothetical protein
MDDAHVFTAADVDGPASPIPAFIPARRGALMVRKMVRKMAR